MRTSLPDRRWVAGGDLAARRARTLAWCLALALGTWTATAALAGDSPAAAKVTAKPAAAQAPAVTESKAKPAAQKATAKTESAAKPQAQKAATAAKSAAKATAAKAAPAQSAAKVSAPAAKTAASKSQVVPVASRPPAVSAAPQDEHVSYQYNALGRRDPFRPLIGGGFVSDIDGASAPPDVGGLKVVGIVWGADDKFALVEDPRGSSMVLRKGDKVMNGVVTNLKRDALIVKLDIDGQTESVAIPLTRKGDQAHESD